jgi:threonine/homoserine/homoserine lactone efflux protein
VLVVPDATQAFWRTAIQENGMTWTAWLAFTVTYTLMALAPGPVVLLVMSYALSQGRRAALAVVAGTVLGDATCLVSAVLGLGAILAASATAFTVLKIAGACYLVFIGVKLWRARPVLRTNETVTAPRNSGHVFLHAYLVTVLNPKSIVFFMIFVPQFLDADVPLAPQLGFMLASVVACGALVDGGYSLGAAQLRRFIRTARTQRAVNRVTGGLLVGEGVLAAGWRGLSL